MPSLVSLRTGEVGTLNTGLLSELDTRKVGEFVGSNGLSGFEGEVMDFGRQ